MRHLFSAGLAVALAVPLAAAADTASDIQALRQEMEAIRANYEQRLQVLEQRLKAAEAAAQTPAASVAVTPPAPASAAPGTGGGANAFNPEISLILSGLYTRTSRDPASYSLSGFHLPLGSEAGPSTRGFSLSESELGLSASIDPWLRGSAAISIAPDNTVSVEEAFI